MGKASKQAPTASYTSQKQNHNNNLKIHKKDLHLAENEAPNARQNQNTQTADTKTLSCAQQQTDADKQWLGALLWLLSEKHPDSAAQLRKNLADLPNIQYTPHSASTSFAALLRNMQHLFTTLHAHNNIQIDNISLKEILEYDAKTAHSASALHRHLANNAPRRAVEKKASPLSYNHCFTIKTHMLGICCLEIDYTETRLLTAADDGSVKITSMHTGNVIHSFEGRGLILDMSISRDNRFICSSFVSGEILIWDMATGEEVLRLERQALAFTLHFSGYSSNGKYLLLITEGGTIVRIICLQLVPPSEPLHDNIDTATTQGSTRHKGYVINSIIFNLYGTNFDESLFVSFSNGYTFFCVTTKSGLIYLFKTPAFDEFATDVVEKVVKRPHWLFQNHDAGAAVSWVDIGQKGSSIYTAATDGYINMNIFMQGTWHLHRLKHAPEEGVISYISISKDETRLYALSSLNNVFLWDIRGAPVCIGCIRSEMKVQSIRTHPHALHLLYVIGASGEIVLYSVADAASPVVLSVLPGGLGKACDFCLSYAGSHYALVDDSGNVSVFSSTLIPRAFANVPHEQFYAWELGLDTEHRELSNGATYNLAFARNAPNSLYENPAVFASSEISDGTKAQLEEEERQAQMGEREIVKVEMRDKKLREICAPLSVRAVMAPVAAEEQVTSVMSISDNDSEFRMGESVSGESSYSYDSEMSDAEAADTEVVVEHAVPQRTMRYRGRGRRGARERSSRGLRELPSPIGTRSTEMRGPVGIRRSTRHREYTEFQSLGQNHSNLNRAASNRTRRSNVVDPLPSNECYNLLDIAMSTRPQKLTPYFPQCGDTVYFSKMIHEKFIKRCDRRIFPSLISTVNASLFRRCTVKNITFEGTPHTMVHIRLCNDDGTEFDLSVPRGFYPDFIILDEFYDWVKEELNVRLGIGDAVYWIDYNSEEVEKPGVVESIISPDIFQIKFATYSCICPVWSVCRRDRLSAYSNQYSHQRVQEHEMQKIVDVLQSEFMAADAYAEFINDVDRAVYPVYYKVVPYPVCLARIVERLGSGYYRSVESLNWDIGMVSLNSRIFNKKNSEIVHKATRLVGMLVKAIDEIVSERYMAAASIVISDADEDAEEISMYTDSTFASGEAKKERDDRVAEDESETKVRIPIGRTENKKAGRKTKKSGRKKVLTKKYNLRPQHFNSRWVYQQEMQMSLRPRRTDSRCPDARRPDRESKKNAMRLINMTE